MNTLQRLPNGLTLVYQTRPGASTTALGLYWLAGSRFEQAHETGVAHLLEHLLLAGRGAARAALGGEIHAGTGRELIALGGVVPAMEAGVLLALLLEALGRPDFQALQREWEVIRLERRLVGDSLADTAQAMGWAGHPLGRSIVGDGTSPPDEATVRDYRQRLLCGRRLWLVAVGPQSPDWLAERVGWLDQLAAGEMSDADPPPTWQGGWRRRPIADGPGRVLWLMPVVGAGAGVDHALLMLRQLLGGDGASLLFQRLREEQGWMYGIDAWLEQYREAGLWGIDIGCEAPRLPAVVAAVTATVEALHATPPDPAMCSRLRRGLEARLLLDEADPARCMARLARETVYLGAPLDLDDHRAGLAAVDGEMLRIRLRRAWKDQLRLSLRG